MPTAPTPITPYATPPSSSDPADFDARADAKVLDDQAKVTEYNNLAGNVYNNALEAEASAADSAASAAASLGSAATAASSAAAAAAAASAPAWVSGTTYAEGAVVWSPADSRVYRRRVGMGGAGTTDPSADSTHWSAVSANGLQMAFIPGTTGTVNANTDTCFTNPAPCAATLGALAVGEPFVVRFDNALPTNTLDVGTKSILGPNGQIRSGVITLDSTPILRLRWGGDYLRSF